MLVPEPQRPPTPKLVHTDTRRQLFQRGVSTPASPRSRASPFRPIPPQTHGSPRVPLAASTSSGRPNSTSVIPRCAASRDAQQALYCHPRRPRPRTRTGLRTEFQYARRPRKRHAWAWTRVSTASAVSATRSATRDGGRDGQRDDAKTVLARSVVRAGDKLGQREVNTAAPEHPGTRDVIWLNRALRPACTSHHERLASTFNPKVAGSRPARPHETREDPRTPENRPQLRGKDQRTASPRRIP